MVQLGKYIAREIIYSRALYSMHKLSFSFSLFPSLELNSSIEKGKKGVRQLNHAMNGRMGEEKRLKWSGGNKLPENTMEMSMDMRSMSSSLQ